MKNKKSLNSLEDKLKLCNATELLVLSRSYMRVGELTEGKIIRDYLRELKCNNALEYFEKGSVLEELHDYQQEALDAFIKAIELEPNYVKAHYMIGKNLMANRQYEKSIEFFNKVIELEPSFLKAYLDKGWVLCELGKDEEALESFNKGIKFNLCIEELCSAKEWILNKMTSKNNNNI